MTTDPPSTLLRPFQSFSAPGFPRIWTAAVLFALGQWTERLAIGWFVFDQTDSAFLTAATIAAAAAPGIIFGPIAGAVSDRSPRPHVLAFAAALKAAVLLTIAILVATDFTHIVLLLLLVAISGVGNSFHISSLHTLSGDIAGPTRRASAISIVSTGQRAVSAAGALGAGIVIATAGPTTSFLLTATAFVLATATYRGLADPRPPAGRAHATFLADTFEGLRIVGQVPMVGILLGLMVVIEIFGFSYMSILPALADRVLNVGPIGLGGLTAAGSLGSVAGTLVLATYADRARLGLLFIGIFCAFGVLLIALGTSNWYAISLLAVAGVGACAAMVDALEWIMLQAAVPDRLRGRVLGAWNVAIGFGWVGPLLLGALADATSVEVTFASAGAILIAVATLAALLFPRLRTA